MSYANMLDLTSHARCALRTQQLQGLSECKQGAHTRLTPANLARFGYAWAWCSHVCRGGRSLAKAAIATWMCSVLGLRAMQTIRRHSKT